VRERHPVDHAPSPEPGDANDATLQSCIKLRVCMELRAPPKSDNFAFATTHR
jgi:hypothetical protein